MRAACPHRVGIFVSMQLVLRLSPAMRVSCTKAVINPALHQRFEREFLLATATSAAQLDVIIGGFWKFTIENHAQKAVTTIQTIS